MNRARSIRPAYRPLDATVVVPGSKSVANRALVCAALASGVSALANVPDGDDTTAMVAGLRGLGVDVVLDGDRVIVCGAAGVLDAPGVTIDAALAGTTSRFLTAVAALSPSPVLIDGLDPLRNRPMGPLHDALAVLGAMVEPAASVGRLPVRVARGELRGGLVALGGDVSSQFLSALMLIAPLLPGGVRVELTTPLVSRPYVEVTAVVMAAFGIDGITVGEREVTVPEGAYRARDYLVEPDASSASYPFAAVAICGGTVHVPGLTAGALQGDVRLLTLLAEMGCSVEQTAHETVVARDHRQPLRGIHVDMADISDLVPTVAAMGAFCSTPTEITGVGFIRAKESNRIDDTVEELRRLSIQATASADGILIVPSTPSPAKVQTHHDHRMAMALALVGLRVPGVSIADPDVVAKSWPGYWAMLDAIVR